VDVAEYEYAHGLAGTNRAIINHSPENHRLTNVTPPLRRIRVARLLCRLNLEKGLPHPLSLPFLEGQGGKTEG